MGSQQSRRFRQERETMETVMQEQVSTDAWNEIQWKYLME